MEIAEYRLLIVEHLFLIQIFVVFLKNIFVCSKANVEYTGDTCAHQFGTMRLVTPVSHLFIYVNPCT